MRKLLAVLAANYAFSFDPAPGEEHAIKNTLREQASCILKKSLLEFPNAHLIDKWRKDTVLMTFESATDAIHFGNKLQSDPGQSVTTVVHAGEIYIREDDVDGDVVSFAVQLASTLPPEEVYFSEQVHLIISGAEFPHKQVSNPDIPYQRDLRISGPANQVSLFRTCFGESAVTQEHIALVQTNFVGVYTLANEHTWKKVHPVLENMTRCILGASRARGGAYRGSLQIGSFITFPTVRNALESIQSWNESLSKQDHCLSIEVRVAVHWGTLNVMQHTMMGQDIDVARTLSNMASGKEILFTNRAVAIASSEAVQTDLFEEVKIEDLRECASRRRWIKRYTDEPFVPLYAVPFLRLFDGSILDITKEK